MKDALLAPNLGAQQASGELNGAWAGHLWESLKANGVSHVAICPGSRSAPLALAVWGRKGFTCTVHHDERSAAFVALGMARANGRAAAVLTTSGSAAANLAPAAAEALQAGLPLILLTADRPAGKRQSGASQVIPQVGLFDPLVLESWDLPQPGTATLEELGHLVARAAAIAHGSPQGPIHLNQALDEPLWPMPGTQPARWAEGARCPWVQAAKLAASPWPIDAQMALKQATRPVLVAGPDALRDEDEAHALLQWAQAQNLPVLAEATSGLRISAHPAIVRGDAILASGWPDPGPDFVVRLGLPPVGKRLERALLQSDAPHLVLSGTPRPSEPFGRAAWVLIGPVVSSLKQAPLPNEQGLAARRPWWQWWQRAQSAVLASEAHAPKALGHLEAALAVAAAESTPQGGLLVLGNSLPIRHIEAFGPTLAPGVRCLGIRGAAGIDGVTSQAIGAALASKRPTLLLTGDLAFLHDLTALLNAPYLAREGASLVVVVLNNDGGGIFQLLPVAQHAEAKAFESLFGTPHGRRMKAAAQALGVAAEEVADPKALSLAVAQAFSQGPGLRVVEAFAPRSELAASLADAIQIWKQAVAEVGA